MKFEVTRRLIFAGTIRMPGDIVEVDGEPAEVLLKMGVIAPVHVEAPKSRMRKKKVKNVAD